MKSKTSNSISISYRGKQSQKRSKENPMQSSQLMKIFEGLLKDIYWAEKALIKVIPKMIKNASSPRLVELLTSSQMTTEIQITRLDKIFESMNKKAISKKSEDMEDLLKAYGEFVESSIAGPKCDEGIILALKKIQHYKIASYGMLCSFSKTLDEDNATDFLQQTVDEEKHIEKMLSNVTHSNNIKVAIQEHSSKGIDSKVEKISEYNNIK